jgi:hypothetical protein
MKELLPSRSCTTFAVIVFQRFSERYNVYFDSSVEAIANAWLEGSPHCQSLPQTGINAMVASGLKQVTNDVSLGLFLRCHVRSWVEHVTPTAYDLTTLPPSVTPKHTSSEDTINCSFDILNDVVLLFVGPGPALVCTGQEGQGAAARGHAAAE